MVPAQGGCRIAPWNIGTERTAGIPEIKYVPAKITTQINPVFFRKLIVDFCIQVIEIVARSLITTGLGDKGADK